MIRDFIKTWFPPLAAMGRKIRRLLIRRQLDMQRKKHGVISRDRLVSDLRSIGVKKGDVLMVHSSLSKMGFVENGAVTVVDACLEAIGPEGTLVMPAFAHNTFSKIYLDTDPVFDVKHDPSRAGAVTEELRTRPGSLRSFHPTDAVTATGPLASYIVKDHFGQLTPYNTFSPYYRLAEKHACILNI